MRVRKRYALLRLICNIGRIAAVVLLVYGLVSLVLTPLAERSYTPPLVAFGAAMSIYITCEGALILVAIEAHARRVVRLLRAEANEPDDPLDDE